jgi:hypothetical protein
MRFARHTAEKALTVSGLPSRCHPFSDAPFALACRPITETKCYLNCEIGPSIATHVKRRDPSRFWLLPSGFKLLASSSALCPLRSGERRLRRDRVIVVVGDVLTAYHDRISSAGDFVLQRGNRLLHRRNLCLQRFNDFAYSSFVFFRPCRHWCQDDKETGHDQGPRKA